MKIKTKDAIGIQLDWLVAKCENLPLLLDPMGFGSAVQGGWWVWYGTPSNAIVGYRPKRRDDSPGYSPSTDWSIGGPIIEKEEIGIRRNAPCSRGREWEASPSITAKGAGGRWGYGPTPLIAAMRAYVASKLGDEVEIPEELA